VTLASLSKAFTATALGLLIDDFASGRNATPLPAGVDELTWSTKVKDIFPGWKLSDPNIYEHLSIKDALSHISGLPRFVPFPFSVSFHWVDTRGLMAFRHDYAYHRSDTSSSVLAKLPYLRPAYGLRQKWEYINLVCLPSRFCPPFTKCISRHSII
jgi:CubicO group peptidase (beta-lactamase class C family)